MRWSSAFAFLHSLIMNFPCLHWACLPAAPSSPQQSEVLAWDCCLCCPSSKRAGGRCLRGWTRGLLMLGAPGTQQSATLVLFPRTGYFDGLGSVEQLFKSQF